ncbi:MULTISPECIES: hypothetical protein [Cylindrospermopsis]|uniref:Uncharacterized protein n=1 Tax=Cylindrospermopsis curvispora GIHE-G1 TaxID=2666332 RepID=A0A7H0F5T0_9CYAN|nr:hypothetical protein [Cylindrospermopsis curvispora]QNP31395.1 hypothetical protein IAR63_17515 [Cylindrospermopsis curvispora GIHE-G1]QNP31396.1 hypothetical protein IAR63_17520 [Cylindrospermopsis curvispora GIHE-G1]
MNVNHYDHSLSRSEFSLEKIQEVNGQGMRSPVTHSEISLEKVQGFGG